MLTSENASEKPRHVTDDTIDDRTLKLTVTCLYIRNAECLNGVNTKAKVWRWKSGMAARSKIQNRHTELFCELNAAAKSIFRRPIGDGFHKILFDIEIIFN